MDGATDAGMTGAVALCVSKMCVLGGDVSCAADAEFADALAGCCTGVVGAVATGVALAWALALADPSASPATGAFGR